MVYVYYRTLGLRPPSCSIETVYTINHSQPSYNYKLCYLSSENQLYQISMSCGFVQPFHINYCNYIWIILFTTGSQFWKTSKRVRAVRKSELRKGKACPVFDSNSDSDFEMPPIFRSQKVSDSTEERLKRLEDQMFSKSRDL